MTQIGDLIEVPPVKTVIQMGDIENPELRSFLTESFLLTDEVKQVLESFMSNIINKQGKGFFLEGNYGSGKSHLLTVISLLLSHQESWQPLLLQDSISEILIDYRDKIKDKKYLMVNVSLVEYSSRERLEDIVNTQIVNSINKSQNLLRNIEGDIKKYNDRLDKNYEGNNKESSNKLHSNKGNFNDVEDNILSFNKGDYKRKDFYNNLSGFLADSDYQGFIILIDELSEFLRSKADGRTFNEDIRFLQFLGEFSVRENCWIMATLQEGIEKTGEITQEVFGKIKDRYPARFHLTGTHIQEIVSQRLIKVKPGAKEKIMKIYKHYLDSFSDWSVSKEDFLSLYPVNPRAITLLDNLKPLFSQHRGIIDFIHYRLQGDPSRNIPGMLEEPAENMLNPDIIFDHFLDRLRETMETRQYYEKAYRYYEQEISSILTEDEVTIGLKLIKILILLAVSPIEKRYNVREISHMLLKPVTDLDASVNYEYIDELLKRLYRHGAYLVLEQGDSTMENTYYLDLKADVNLIIDQKTDYIKSNFFTEERRIFTKVGSLINENYLPLAELLDKPKSIRTVYWQNTERVGYFLLIPMDDITMKTIDYFNDRLRNINLDNDNADFRDFVIFLAYPLEIEEQKEYIKDVIFPELAAEERASYCFWIPENLNGIDLLRNVLARQLLLEEYQDKNGETAFAVREKLEAMLQEDRKNIIAFFRQAFFNGHIIDGNGEQIIDLQEIGVVPFSKLLERITGILLENRYPEHVKIAPYQSVINDGQLNNLCQNFLEPGEIDKKIAGAKGLSRTIEDVLNPLGLINNRGQKIRLNVNPGKNPLLKIFFSSLSDERTDIDYIYKFLRKGSYGLSRPQFKVIIFVLLYTGYITAFSDKQKIALSQLNMYKFSRIKYLGYGEIIAEEFQLILKDCNLLPPRFKEQPFSLPLQHDIWSYLTELKREMMDVINNLKVKLTNLTLDGGLEYINHQQLITNLDKVRDLFEEIKVSYSAEEGLERFASSYSNTPNIDNYLERYHLIKGFLEEGYQKLIDMKNYLNQIPDEFPDRGNFPEIVKLRKELLGSIEDQAIIFTEGFLEGVLDRFDYLKQLYVEEYYTEHQKNLSGERFKLYNNIENSKDYQVLSRLSDIELISVKDDLIKVQRMVNRVVRQGCSKLNRESLNRSPICICGFKPGEQIHYVSLEEIHSVIGRGIAQYLKALDNKDYKDKIDDYLNNMEAVGEKRFARPVRELLEFALLNLSDINTDIIEKIYQILNRNIINRINQALGDSISLHERNLDQLYENLVGRSFAIDQLKQIFNDWLEEDQSLDKHSYVRVIAHDSRVTNNIKNNTEQLIENFLEEYYPELLAYYDQLGEEVFSLFIGIVIWYDKYELKLNEFGDLINFPLELFNDINKNTVYQVWERLSEDDNISVEARVRNNIKRQMNNNNIVHQLIDIIPMSDFEDMIRVLEQEFISYELIRQVLIIMIKRTEKGLTGKSISLYIERLEQALSNIDRDEAAVYIELAKSYLQLRFSLFILESKEKPETTKEWNVLYREHLSHLEYSLSKLFSLAKSIDLLGKIPINALSDTVQEILSDYMQEFYDFSKSNLFRINEQASEYLQREVQYVDDLDLSELILERYHEMIKRINNQGNTCILLDGMRQDTWDIVKTELFNNLNLRVIKEGLLYANLPTNTETQLARLKESGFRGDIITPEEYFQRKSDFILSDNSIIKNDGIIREIVKFSYIDDKVHTSKECYSQFMEEIRFQTINRLIPFLEKIPERTMILIVSDHGYRINHQFNKNEKYDSPRYLHGGDSPQEVIVPWALLYKI